jgi:chitodextrinase
MFGLTEYKYNMDTIIKQDKVFHTMWTEGLESETQGPWKLLKGQTQIEPTKNKIAHL